MSSQPSPDFFHKMMSTVCFIFCLSLVLFPKGALSADYPPDLQRIFKRGKIIVAMHKYDSVPYFMHDSKGRFHGLDVDLARGIGRRLGVQVEFNRKAETYDNVIDIIARKEADIGISSLSNTLERSKRVRFTEPYLILKLALLLNRLTVAQEKKGKDTYDFLQATNSRIGVLTASSHVGYVQEIFPKAAMKLYENFDPDIVNAVLKGEVIGGFFDELEIKRVIYEKPELSLNLQMFILNNREDLISIAVPWDSVHLLAWLNLYLKKLKLELTADKILYRYSDLQTPD